LYPPHLAVREPALLLLLYTFAFLLFCFYLSCFEISCILLSCQAMVLPCFCLELSFFFCSFHRFLVLSLGFGFGILGGIVFFLSAVCLLHIGVALDIVSTFEDIILRKSRCSSHHSPHRSEVPLILL
jgi:hypothetical protein